MKISDINTINLFIKKYEVNLELDFPGGSPKNSICYGAYNENKLLGGILISNNKALYAIEQYISLDKRERIYAKIHRSTTFIDVSILWLSDGLIESYVRLFHLGMKLVGIIKKIDRPYIVYGTNRHSIAQLIYDLPSVCLLESETMNNVKSWIFICKKNTFPKIVWLLMGKMAISKFNSFIGITSPKNNSIKTLSLETNACVSEKEVLKYTILTELSMLDFMHS